MYRLTLTDAERAAIDWVGYRYRHGDELFGLLLQCVTTPEGAEWEEPGDITFHVPEHVAWRIGEIVNEGLDCFADELVSKLVCFASHIV